MAKKKKKNIRGDTLPREALSYFLSPDAYSTLCSDGGYRRISEDPDVRTGINIISNLVASMTMKMMENQDEGPDQRIKDGLSSLVDISPCHGLTKQSWVQRVVNNLVLYGNCYVKPEYITADGDQLLLDQLIILENSEVSKDPDANPYGFIYNNKRYDYDELIHFRVNMRESGYFGYGVEVLAKDAVSNLNNSNRIVNEFLTKKFMPSLIIKVDATAARLAKEREVVNSETGSIQKSLVKKYLDSTGTGEPFVIPASQMSVE